MIKALSYVVVSTPNVEPWCETAQRIVGLQAVETGDAVRLRMDGKVQRLLLQRTEGAPTLTMGLEVADAAALAEMAARVEAAGIRVRAGTAEEIELRGVADLFAFQDLDGNPVEVSYGLRDDSSPFQPGRPIGGFRTGELGIGHVALKCGDYKGMVDFYRETLGFRLSDYSLVPFPCTFLHVNPRHHTLGLADAGTGPGVYHLMLEYKSWDDVGRAYDMALENPDSIGVSLGRHSNDHVTSFYLRTPDEWLIELGWAGRLVDDETWEVQELPSLSLWGHDRSWLPPEKRKQAKALTDAMGERGVRAPVALPEGD